MEGVGGSWRELDEVEGNLRELNEVEGSRRESLRKLKGVEGT